MSGIGVPDISEAGGDQKGVMDSLLESLKTGDVYARKRRQRADAGPMDSVAAQLLSQLKERIDERGQIE